MHGQKNIQLCICSVNRLVFLILSNNLNKADLFRIADIKYTVFVKQERTKD